MYIRFFFYHFFNESTSHVPNIIIQESIYFSYLRIFLRYGTKQYHNIVNLSIFKLYNSLERTFRIYCLSFEITECLMLEYIVCILLFSNIEFYNMPKMNYSEISKIKGLLCRQQIFDHALLSIFVFIVIRDLDIFKGQMISLIQPSNQLMQS